MTTQPQKLDPTRTALLRRRFMAEIERRLRRLQRDIYQLIAVEDALGLRYPTINAGFDPNQPRDEFGRWVDVGLSMPTGIHTSEGQRKLIKYLEKKTGLKFKAWGSLKDGGKTSINDIDIIQVPPTEEEVEQANYEYLKQQDEMTKKRDKGEITQEQLMDWLYGEETGGISDVEKALAELGFKPTKLMRFTGIDVTRYENPESKHTIEVWEQGDAGYNDMESIDLTKNSSCGAGEPGKPGFQPGNTCARGGLVAQFPKVKGSHDLVDGRRVLKDVPNLSSIGSSLTDYTVMPGIRRVKTSDFLGWRQPYTETRVDEIKHTKALAEAIRRSKKISPLIVVLDREGLYVLEGGHRYEALRMLRAQELPAVVVVDRSEETGVTINSEDEVVTSNSSDCGAGEPGKPGFQPGNTCAKGSNFLRITGKRTSQDMKNLRLARQLIEDEFGAHNVEHISVRFKKMSAAVEEGSLQGSELSVRPIGAIAGFGSPLESDQQLELIVHELLHDLHRDRGWYKGGKWLGVSDDVEYHNRAREIHARFAAQYLVARWKLSQGSISQEQFDKYFKPEYLDPVWALKRSQEKVTRNSSCGAGEEGNPGFQPGNTCAGGTRLTISIIQSILDEFHRLATEDKREHQAIFSLDGNLIHRDVGVGFGESETEISPHVVIPVSQLLNDNGIIQVHTHPGGGGPSDGDWGMFGWGNVKAMAMVGPNETYLLEHQGDGRRPSPRELKDAWNEIEGGLEQRPGGLDDIPKLLHDTSLEMIKRFPQFKMTVIPKSITQNQLVANTRWRFMTSAEKLQQFKLWLFNKIAVDLLPSDLEDSWLIEYIRQGYLKGMARVFDYLQKPELDKPAGFYEGSKRQFLESAFTRPVSVNRVKLLAARTYEDLKGMTEQMSTQMGRELVDGMVQGLSPREVARNITKHVDGIGRKRALMIARTETIRAHADGQLDAMRELGVEEVGVAVEWSTSKMGVTKLGNPSPCKLCAPLEGIVLKLDEAEGLIPRHPNAVFAGSTFTSYGECKELVRAWYRGPSVVLTLGGRRDRTTIGPNHPVLTKRGMIPAAQLEEGDEVLYDLRGDLSSHCFDLKQIPMIEDVFTSSVSILGDRSVVTSTSDLHGDKVFCHGEVKGIRPAGSLLRIRDSFGIEQLRQESLARSNSNTELLPSYSSLDFPVEGVLAASSSLLSVNNLSSPLLAGHATPSQFMAVGGASSDHPHRSQSLENNSTRDSEMLCDHEHRFSGLVLAQNFFVWKVVHGVTFSEYEGWAFDATTATSLYCNNNLVVSNCMCSFIPANVGENTAKQKRTRIRIIEAIKKSVGAERGKKKRSLREQRRRSRWVGAGARISKRRPQPIV